MTSKLLTLPLEIFEIIVSGLDPPSVFNVCLSCRKLGNIATPLLYRRPRFNVQLSCTALHPPHFRDEAGNFRRFEYLSPSTLGPVELFVRTLIESPEMFHLVQYLQLNGVHSDRCISPNSHFKTDPKHSPQNISIELSHFNIHSSYKECFNLIHISYPGARLPPSISHKRKVNAFIINPLLIDYDRLHTILQTVTLQSTWGGAKKSFRISGWNSEMCRLVRPQLSQTLKYTSIKELIFFHLQDDSLEILEMILEILPSLEKFDLRYAHSRYAIDMDQLNGWNVRLTNLLHEHNPGLKSIHIWNSRMTEVIAYGSIYCDFSSFKQATELLVVPELILNLNENTEFTPEISNNLPVTLKIFYMYHDIKMPYTSQIGLFNTVRALNKLWADRRHNGKTPDLSDVVFRLKVDSKLWRFPYLERESLEDTLIFKPMAHVLRQVKQIINPGIDFSISYFNPPGPRPIPGTRLKASTRPPWRVPPVSEQLGRIVECHSDDIDAFIFPEDHIYNE
jgi:hypothetical protein